MKIAWTTPIGPGHEHERENCEYSTSFAFRHHRGPFQEMRHFFLDDTDGWHGRAYARNVLLARAKGWGADWVIQLDSTDIAHFDSLRRIGEVLERRPDVPCIMGCISLWFSPRDAAKNELRSQFMYRSPYDICPLSWSQLLEHMNIGTIGTHSAVRMDLAWKLGFRCDLPAAEMFEHSHACFANAEYEKIPHPINVIDRSAGHSGESGTFENHGPRLMPALEAIRAVWSERGRKSFSYAELEDRWRSRWTRTDELFQDRPFEEAIADRGSYLPDLD